MRRTAARSSSSCVVLFLVFSVLWLFLGEVGIYYIYSLRWQWPQQLNELNGYLKKHLIRDNPPGTSLDSSQRYHYQNGDTHYYTRPERFKRSATTSSTQAGMRILILSDPHIMCTFDKEEPWLSRRDADLYLSTIYSHLMKSLPELNMVILLGDIFSDGFQATHSQWKDYLNCLEKIFPISNPDIRLLVIFGDNDIGGEGKDYMTDEGVGRYVQAFGALNSDKWLVVEGVQFIKLTTVCFINKFPKTQSEIKCREDLESYISRSNDNFQEDKPIRLALSHIPLHQTHLYDFTMKQKLLKMDLNYIMSGHIHKEYYETHVMWDSNGRDMKLTHEITVPTCNYRMGEKHMGVGVAIIGSDGDMVYCVLWLPPRYPFLFSYIILLFVFMSILCRSSICRSRNKCCI